MTRSINMRFGVLFLLLFLARSSHASYLRRELVSQAFNSSSADSYDESEIFDNVRILGSQSSDENGIYYAGLVTQYNTGQIQSMLRKHDRVAFIKKYRGKKRLVLTKRCTLSSSTLAGAYYCADHSTVCVSSKSVSRFYGPHTSGGPCKSLPLSDDIVKNFPDEFKAAYENTCDGDKCDGG